MNARPPRVLVLATETVPLPGLPTNGGGLRGWTLARGLAAAGLDVTLVFPREPLDALAPELDPTTMAAALPQTFSWADPGAAIRRHAPDVVVCCSWFLAARLGPCPVPLAVDLAGPILLEFLYQDRAKAREFAALKPRGLALADFVTCAGERQRAYFYPWLTLAGFDQDDLTARVAVVPISVAPDPAPDIAAPGNAEPSILCAGVVLPWQDPLMPLRATLETLERRERGTLDLFLYAHPEHSRGARWIEWVREEAAPAPLRRTAGGVPSRRSGVRSLRAQPGARTRLQHPHGRLSRLRLAAALQRLRGVGGADRALRRRFRGRSRRYRCGRRGGRHGA